METKLKRVAKFLIAMAELLDQSEWGPVVFISVTLDVLLVSASQVLTVVKVEDTKLIDVEIESV